MRGGELGRRARRRWRRATGAEALASAGRRTTMAAIAVGEETRLMAQAEQDLRSLEAVVLSVAERRTRGA